MFCLYYAVVDVLKRANALQKKMKYGTSHKKANEGNVSVRKNACHTESDLL